MAELLEGVVERIDANLSHVRVGERILLCEIRKKLFRYDPVKTDIAVGDNVRLEPLDEEGKGVIEEVLPRKSKLNRRTSMGGDEQIIAANIDQLVSVSAVKEPRLSPGLIDRYLVIAEKHGFDAVVCINKIDLSTDETCNEKVNIYRDLGYPVVLVSATRKTNLELFRQVLAGKNSILAGHSGVGKSSLINALIPGVELETKEISRKWRKGKHATTAVTMFRLPSGGYITDTPGIREFGLWGIRKEELHMYFRDFEPYIGECRFRNCTHISEPDCMVKRAVEAGEIRERRYDSYLTIYDSIEEDIPWS
jgi:ribosome biogenesis GTPase